MADDRIIAVQDIRAGMVIYDKPGNLIVADVVVSESHSLGSLRRDKHPLLVLSVDHAKEKIVVTYIASFTSSTTLRNVKFPGDLEKSASTRKLFYPIKPAEKEYDYEPIEWEENPNPSPSWVSVRSKTTLTGSEFKLYDLHKSFSRETAAYIDSLIIQVV